LADLPAWLPLLGLALGFAVPFMAATWIVAVRIRNAGIVDIAWSASFGPIALLYALAGHGWAPRRWLITGMVLLWSTRLAAYLWRRVMGHHPEEDTRYRDLRRRWAPRADARFFWFFQAQAVAAVGLSLPFSLAAVNPAPGLGPFEWAGMALWATGLTGESLADAQLGRFRADPANRGLVCRAGLWRYSRHPNYFFEWLIWCGYAAFALGSPWGALALACPAVMLYLLLRVTGIPALEAAAVRSRGDAYREYQRSTSAFVPWFPRR
jgi:steroid 5-alpha reductase family enzyme